MISFLKQNLSLLILFFLTVAATAGILYFSYYDVLNSEQKHIISHLQYISMSFILTTITFLHANWNLTKEQLKEMKKIINQPSQGTEPLIFHFTLLSICQILLYPELSTLNMHYNFVNIGTIIGINFLQLLTFYLVGPCTTANSR